MGQNPTLTVKSWTEAFCVWLVIARLDLEAADKGVKENPFSTCEDDAYQGGTGAVGFGWEEEDKCDEEASMAELVLRRRRAEEEPEQPMPKSGDERGHYILHFQNAGSRIASFNAPRGMPPWFYVGCARPCAPHRHGQSRNSDVCFFRQCLRNLNRKSNLILIRHLSTLCLRYNSIPETLY